MGEVSKGEGRTVLFVSHNMAAIQQLCNHLIYLRNGIVDYKGAVLDGLNIYFNSIRQANDSNKEVFRKRNKDNKKAIITGFDVRLDKDTNSLSIFVNVEARLLMEKIEVAVGINDALGTRLVTFHSRFTQQQFNLKQGVNKFVCDTENFFLKQDNYSINIFLGSQYETLDYLDVPVDFEIPEYSFYDAGLIPDSSQGYIMARHNWSLKNN